MPERIESYIACPECLSDLKLYEGKGQRHMRCTEGHLYPIFNDVPVLVKKDIILDILNPEERKTWRGFLSGRGIKVPKMPRKESLLVKSARNWGFQWKEYTLEGSNWQDKKMALDYLPITDEDISSSKVILDIGTGNGRFIQHTRRNNIVFGLDISESAYHARKKYKDMDNVFIVRGDLCALPFREGIFDLVVADRVMHHIYDLDKALSEIRRTASGRHVFAFNFFRREGNFFMTRIVIPFKRIFLDRLGIRTLNILSIFFGAFLYLLVNYIYRPVYWLSRKLYRMLPMHENMEFWFPCSYAIYREIALDLMHSPVDHYFSSREMDHLCEMNGLKVEKKRSFRQVFWLIRGRFSER